MKNTNHLQTTMSLPPAVQLQTQAEEVFDVLDVRASTRSDYKQRVGVFLDFINTNGLNFNSFLEFKRHLSEKSDWSVSTKNKYLATAKILLKELNRRGVLPADITQNIKTFSQSKKHKREGLNEAEMGKLVEYLRTLKETPQNARIRALMALLALQGLRQIEIIRLNVGDVDLAGKIAFVQGKGQDDKEPVNLHPATVNALREYLKTNKIADGALFTSNSNNSLNKRLTTRSLRELVKTTLRILDIDKTTHGFRHYFTTTLVKTYKGDLLEVARYTRHKSLEMLQVYNDNVNRKADLPRYYKAFSGVRF